MFFVPSCVILCRISCFSCAVTQNSMRIGLVRFAAIHSPPSVNDEKLCIGRYTFRKTSLHFATDIFSPFVRAKTGKRQRKMRSVFVESGSAFYLRVCDFGEQQAQPVYVHTAIFACWEHPKPIHKSRKAGREICRNTLILFANRTTIYNEQLYM